MDSVTSESRMGARYRLGDYPLGGAKTLPLTECEYQSLLSAKEILAAGFSIEETFDLLSSNYLELEKEALSLTTNLMLRSNFDHDVAFRIRSKMNRRTVNLLSSIRTYLDQLKTNTHTCLADSSDPTDKTKELRRNEYDTNVDYRFGEALRNYAQHNGLAVHDVNFPQKWLHQSEEVNDIKLEYNLKIFSRKLLLQADKKFKASVLAELPDQVELRYCIRSYMGSINRIHSGIRKITDQHVNAARNLIKVTMGDFIQKTGYTNSNIFAFELDSDTPPLLLSLEWDNLRANLRKRNETPDNLSKRYVSGRP